MVSAPVARSQRDRVLTRIEIGGMDCGECAKTVQHSLAAMPGVSEARVSFAGGAADIRYDPAATDV